MKSYAWTIILSAGGMWFTLTHDSIGGFIMFLAVFALATAGLYRLGKGEPNESE